MKHAKRQKICARQDKKTKLINGNKIMHQGGVQNINSYIDNTANEQAQRFATSNRKGYNFRHDQVSHSLRISHIEFDWDLQIRAKQNDFIMVEELTLMGCEVTPDNLRILAQMKWNNLKRLSIFRDQTYYMQTMEPLTAFGIAELLQGDWPCLEDLYVADNEIRNQGIGLLFDSNLRTLKSLDAGLNQIGPTGLRNIPSTLLANLATLNLHMNNIGSQGVKFIVKAHFPLLEDLALSICRIGNEGAHHLTKGYWPNLNRLSINRNFIQLEGFEQLPNNNWDSELLFHQIFEGCGCCSAFGNQGGIGSEIKTLQLFALCTWNTKYLPAQ